jgi:hypothetical protein
MLKWTFLCFVVFELVSGAVLGRLALQAYRSESGSD